MPGVTAARGFLASGVHAGIRKARADLALVVSDRPASAAAVFTTNRVQAAPVLVSRRNLRASGGRARAIVVNSGNANACTGEAGLLAARATADEAARLLGVPPDQVLVASTGVIGVPLPVTRLLTALPAAVSALSPAGGANAAEAILTTDTCTKLAARTVRGAAGHYTVGGMAKGSGMIHPSLATTLAFVTTDARVPPGLLRRALRRAAEVSFNRISVDGDTSTNDMVAALAGGASGVAVRAGASEEFEEALAEVLVDLARQVARDGEGATRLITVQVDGAASEAAALRVARAVAGSPLVKTAVHGADPNWGRVAAAVGRAGVPIEPDRMRVAFGDVEVLGPGYASGFPEDEARRALSGREVTIRVHLGQGTGSATAWTCDLGPGYVRINASYRT
jgi:glutamate N-acetyltransferase/amino-acid N-acetyltransferase